MQLSQPSSVEVDHYGEKLDGSMHAVSCYVEPLLVPGEAKALQPLLLAEDKMAAAHHQQAANQLLVDLLLNWEGSREEERGRLIHIQR